jgi:pimeloyl-ACP methyl ester carboxylesterase
MKDIILLHGAIGSVRQLEPLADSLKEQYNIHLLNLPGHAGRPFPETGFSMGGFAQAVLEYVDENNIQTASLFGYSMGGYVSMVFGQKYPERVDKIITLATKFYWDEVVATREIALLQAETIELKIPAFARELEKRHAPLDWKEQLAYTKDLLAGLGKKNPLTLEDYKNIKIPCMLMLGDRDKMVTLSETVDVYAALPNASLAVLPQTPHAIEKTAIQLLKFNIDRFMDL